MSPLLVSFLIWKLESWDAQKENFPIPKPLKIWSPVEPLIVSRAGFLDQTTEENEDISDAEDPVFQAEAVDSGEGEEETDEEETEEETTEEEEIEEDK